MNNVNNTVCNVKCVSYLRIIIQLCSSVFVAASLSSLFWFCDPQLCCFGLVLNALSVVVLGFGSSLPVLFWYVFLLSGAQS